jgi:hypothetical protein
MRKLAVCFRLAVVCCATKVLLPLLLLVLLLVLRSDNVGFDYFLDSIGLALNLLRVLVRAFGSRLSVSCCVTRPLHLLIRRLRY